MNVKGTIGDLMHRLYVLERDMLDIYPAPQGMERAGWRAVLREYKQFVRDEIPALERAFSDPKSVGDFDFGDNGYTYAYQVRCYGQIADAIRFRNMQWGDWYQRFVRAYDGAIGKTA